MQPAGIALLGLLLIGAAPVREPLPVPPIPPGSAPAVDAAPVPDTEARGPAENAPGGIRVRPSLYRHEKTFTQGEGYTPGSAFRETEQERFNKPAPGFNLRMPLP